MPIRVYYDEPGSSAGWCTIRPTPFISMSTAVLKTGASESLGVTYQITLTGKLIAHRGSPYSGRYLDHVKYDIAPSAISPEFVYPPDPNYIGPYGAFDSSVSHYNAAVPQNRPSPQIPTPEENLSAIMFKQKAIRELFSRDFRKLEITDWNDDSVNAIYCYPRVVSVDFSEGLYVETCDYTIVLEADSLLDADDMVDREASSVVYLDDIRRHTTEQQLIETFSGAFIQSYNEDWSIEADESLGETVQDDLNIYLPQSYRITRNLSCTGKRHFVPGDKTYEAWEMARKFVTNKLKNEKDEYATDPNGYYLNRGHNELLSPQRRLASGSMNLVSAYNPYNHVITEQISKTEGSFSITESWLLATGQAYENFQMSISNSIDAPFVDVSINGTIKGLTTKRQTDYDLDKNVRTGNTPAEGEIEGSGRYRTALNKYYEITNNGGFGITSDIYKRVNNSVAIELNSQPKSISLGTNEFTGEITYSMSFDNRPLNIVSGVLSEQISVNDTYPGDVIAVIPVLGRQTGPVLQYMGGRTEYRRDVSINLLMDYNKIAYGKTRDPLMLKKPSVVQPQATQLQQLLTELSPSNEPGIRKYFLATPPSESWNPKDGTYSINLSWVYELDK